MSYRARTARRARKRAQRCPDCNGPGLMDGLAASYAHEPSCPLNGAVDRAVDDDLSWFQTHPGATKRVRPITPAEVSEMRAVDPNVQPTDQVHVLADGRGLMSRLAFGPDGRSRRAVVVGGDGR